VDIKPRLGGRSGTGRPRLVAAAVTPGWDGGDSDAMGREMDASQAVTAIYQRHALGLTRLAFLMLGDRQSAEDVVQEAFCGLYRAWDRMSDHAHALSYVRASVLNGSRSALRRSRRVPRPLAVPAAASAEATVLAGERQRETVGGAAAVAAPAARGGGAALLRRPARAGDRSGHGRQLRHGEIHHLSGAGRPGPDAAGGGTVTQLEERLRADMRAESKQIEPGSISALQLPARAHPPGRLRRRGPRHWPAWATALAAAAAVTVVIAGTFLIAHVVSQSGPNPPATGGPPPYSGIPPFYAYAVQGSIVHGTQNGDSVIARYVKIRATASGKVLRTVSPPAPYNAFESFTGAADARTFVFAAQWYIHGKMGVPRLYKQDQKTPLKFMILRIMPGGRTQLSPLSLPGRLTEAQAPTLALSPDGAKLAVAYGGSGKPAVVQVITLATGQMRQWTSPPPAATPVLGGPGAGRRTGEPWLSGRCTSNPAAESAPSPPRCACSTPPRRAPTWPRPARWSPCTARAASRGPSSPPTAPS